MTTTGIGKLAVLWRGDRAARRQVTTTRPGLSFAAPPPYLAMLASSGTQRPKSRLVDVALKALPTRGGERHQRARPTASPGTSLPWAASISSGRPTNLAVRAGA